jgi:Cobalamin biosynthesis protein CbiD
MKILKDMPKESFIEIGDYVSYSIRKAAGSGIKRVIFAGQFGKIVKISQGARNTNAKYGNLDLKYLGALVKAVLKEHIDIIPENEVNDLYEKIINSNTSRQVYDYILSLCNIYNPLPDKIFYNILKSGKGKFNQDVQRASKYRYYTDFVRRRNAGFYIIKWIPAYAGMTPFGLKVKSQHCHSRESGNPENKFLLQD